MNQMKRYLLSLILILAFLQSYSQYVSVDYFAPTSGYIPETVTISGNGFSDYAPDNTVYFGPVKATVTSANMYSLKVVIPPGAGYGPISVNYYGYTSFARESFTPAGSGYINLAPHSYTNSGAFTLTTGTTRYSGLCDMDGDGKPDIVGIQCSANGQNNELFILRTNTSGTGQTTYQYFAVSNAIAGPKGMVIEDIDGDGQKDIIVADSTGPILIFRNTSGVNNLQFSKVSIPSHTVPMGIEVGDFDQNKQLDIAVLTSSNKIRFYKNKGTYNNIQFIDADSVQVGRGNGYLNRCDVNGDGKEDIISVNEIENTISIVVNTGEYHTMSFAPAQTVAVGQQPVCVKFADLNYDYVRDIIVGNAGSKSLSIVRAQYNNGQATFSTVETIPVGSTLNDIQLADLNGDQKVDLAISSRTPQGPVLLAINNSDRGSAISFQPFINIPSDGNSQQMVVGDINLDGKPDIVTAGGMVNSLLHTGKIPVVERFTPGIAGRGESITITGSSFDFATSVTFGGYPADSFRLVSSDTIIAYVAQGQSGIIGVTTPLGTGNIGNFVFNGQTTIRKVSPLRVKPGDTIHIEGINLDNATAVTFGGENAASFRINSAVSITAVVGAGYSGDIKIYSAKDSAVYNGFVVTAPPVINSFTPLSGRTGDTINISGVNFTDASAVTIGGVPADTFGIISPGKLIAIVGNGATGDIIITTPYGTGSKSGFSYNAFPVIKQVTPMAGDSGTIISITGNNFNNVTAVSFGGKAAASFSVVSPNIIKAVLSNGSSGQLLVTTAAGTAAKDGFTYTSTPFITDITPARSSNGATIRISGVHFSDIIAVTIGNIAATAFTVESDTLITATAGSFAPGNWTVVVNNSKQSAAYKYFYNGPIINGFSPANGPAHSLVTINGANFNTSPAQNIVYFGATKAIVKSATDKTLVVEVPDGALPESISVSNGGLIAYSSIEFHPVFQGTDTALNAGLFATPLQIDAIAQQGIPFVTDLDGDGLPDVLLTNESYSSFSAFRNNSSYSAISFAARKDFAMDYNSITGIIGDFNGDGLNDVITTSYNAANISVFQNTSSVGNINFKNIQQLVTGEITSLAATDLDGDGKAELLTASTASNQLTIYTNNGALNNVSLVSIAKIPLPGPGYGLTTADVDGDGLYDIIVSNSALQIISILRNTSTPGHFSFAPLQNLSIDGNPSKVLLKDLDGDNKQDLIFLFNDKVGIFKNSSRPGKISFSDRISAEVGKTSKYLTVADFDGDNLLDIAVSNGGITLFKNTSRNGKISLAKGAPINEYISGISSGDLNNDGKPDLIGIYDLGYVTKKLFIYKNIAAKYKEPLITAITPARAVAGDTVIIKGQRLTGTTSVGFGGIPAASFTVTSDSVITVIAGTGKTGNVHLITPYGTAMLPGFVSPPHIISFSPTSGKIGDTITISGSGLNSVYTVAFGKAPEWVGASYIKVLSHTTIKAVIGDCTSGNMYIFGSDGVDSISGFTFIPPPPQIESFKPQTANIGTAITITGNYFTGVSKVTFGGVPADSVIVLSASKMIAVVGKGASGDVVITTPTGTGSMSGFTCLPGIPQITGFTPDNGNIGTEVTIKGRYFDPTPNKNIVYFGAVRAVVAAATDSTLTVNVPTGASHQPISITTRGLTAQASKAFTVTFTGGLLDTSSFVKRSDYQIGGSSFNLLAYDLDGDQNVDLIAPYNVEDRRAVRSFLKNNGNATFGAVQTSPINVSIEDAEFTDMDGDGKKDLVVSQDLDSYTVGVARNISSPGAINFGAHKSLTLISLAGNRMTTGDIDGDGRPDVYVLSQNSMVTRVGRNITTDTTIAVESLDRMGFGGYPRAIAICDMDGDGKKDLITSSPSDGGVVIHTNTSLKGIISLGSNKIIPVFAYEVWAADLDGDNRPELITISNNNAVAICKNNSTPGTVAMGSPVELSLGYKAYRVAIGDLDGDGKPDLAVAGSTPNVISVFRNLSDGNQISFAPKINYPADNKPNAVVISDLNGDGKPDIATAGANGMVSIYINQINAALQPAIQSFTPDSARYNDSVTITGQRFTGATSVSFGGIPASSFQILNDSTISAVVAGGSSGKVSIVTARGVTARDGFIFLPDKPALTRFSPATGTLRSIVTIAGKFLNGTKAVTFGGIPAKSFAIISDSVITAIVGSGNSGAVAIFNESGKDSLSGFTYIPPVPVITVFTPATATKLDTVTINGQYLDLATSVSFGGVAAESFSVMNDTTLKAIVADGMSGNVEVKASTGTATRSGFQFRIPMPVLYDIVPNKGRAGDTIRLSGYNLQWVNQVSFGGVTATSIRVLSDSLVVAVLGKGATGTVTITSPGGNAYAGGFSFIYPAPVITSFSPTAAKPGTVITIKGDYLTSVYQVLLGGATTLYPTTLSDSVITATVDQGATGAVKVISDWGTDTLSGFTYVSPDAVINRFSPATATTGQTVTIYGDNLSKAYQVLFGGTDALSMRVVSDSVITAVVGNGTSGKVIVRLSNDVVSLDGFTYQLPSPVVNSFIPVMAGKGATITIQGKNFNNITDVQFGGTSASSFLVISDSVLTAVVGAGSSGMVTVVAGSQRGQAPGFTFLTPPVISSFAPATATEGSTVTIIGSYFKNATAITFGGQQAASFTVITDSLIRAIVGKGASGDISVTTPSGTGKRNGFTFLTAPANVIVTGFTPASGGTGTNIIISGKGFSNATAVSFGGTPASSFYVISDSTISAVIGNGSNGAVAVSSVSNPTAVLDGFIYLTEAAPPLRFYPNPAVGYTWVEHPVSEQAKIFLLNQAGDIIKTIPATPGVGKTQFNLSGIQPGYYFISWRDGNQSISKAIVVMQ